MSKFKLRISILVLIFSLSVSMKAEDKGIPIPDNVGKHLFELFQNRVNITSSPFYKSATSKKEWTCLMREADRLSIAGDSISYQKTFFAQVRNYGEKASAEKVEIHVLMNTTKGEYAFGASLLWNDGWEIQRISTQIYKYEAMSIDDGAPKFEVALGVMESSASLVYPYNPYYKVSAVEETTYIPDVATLNNAVFEALKNQPIFSYATFLMTEQEFVEVMGGALKEYSEVILKNPNISNEEKEMFEKIQDNPLYVYEKELQDGWHNLMTSCAKEFGDNVSKFELANTEITISNHVVDAIQNLWMSTSMNIIVDGEEVRSLRYQGLYYGGEWKTVKIDGYLIPNWDNLGEDYSDF